MGKISPLQSCQLWTPLYLSSVGMYATVGGLFGGIYVLQQDFGLGYWKANLLAFFVVILVRALYESLVVHKTPWRSVEIQKFIEFSAKSALFLVPILYVLKGPLGEWAVLVTVAISSRITGRIKARLWPSMTHASSEPLRRIFEKKLPVFVRCLYVLFLATAVSTYFGVQLWGLAHFFPIFGFSLFVSLLLHMMLEWHLVYERSIDLRFMTWCVLISAVSSIVVVAYLFGTIGVCQWQGKPATISGLIGLKLLQPWCVRILLSREQG